MQVHTLKGRIEAKLEAVDSETTRLLDVLAALEQLPTLAANYGVMLESNPPQDHRLGDKRTAVQESTPLPPQPPEAEDLSPLDLLRNRLAEKYSMPQSQSRFSLAS